jgi:putative NADPH-quinone reductase
MAVKIVIIDGHPDPAPERFGHALAQAYADGASEAGHEVRRVEVAALDFPLLRSKDAFEDGVLPESLRAAQDAIAWAGHLVIVYPLWLGTMPALLKGFLEQVFRPGFAVGKAHEGDRSGGLLKGRSARIVVTMGMPALIYRWYFGAHSLKSLERNILRFSGIGPIRETLIGMVEGGDGSRRNKALAKLRSLGREGR